VGNVNLGDIREELPGIKLQEEGNEIEVEAHLKVEEQTVEQSGQNDSLVPVGIQGQSKADAATDIGSESGGESDA
jgi:hypothetical protein